MRKKIQIKSINSVLLDAIVDELIFSPVYVDKGTYVEDESKIVFDIFTTRSMRKQFVVDKKDIIKSIMEVKRTLKESLERDADGRPSA